MSAGDWSLPHLWKTVAAKRTASRRQHWHFGPWMILAAAAVAVVLAMVEIRTSWFEAHIFAAVARRETYTLQPGPSPATLRPGRGPYDQRLGYAFMPEFVGRLESQGYRVAAQVRNSEMARALAELGLFPVYREKDQAGLRILDRNGRPLDTFAVPAHVYSSFDSIPPLVVNTLLFIENRQLLDPSHPFRNPAAQWSRFSRAVWDLSLHEVDHRRAYIGGSTLATQLEKMRHSPGGRTGSAAEKARQMLSASLLAYRNGPRTLEAQRQIVLSYLNSIPLGAQTGRGEVIGLADGLRSWYGASFSRVNRLLAEPENNMPARQFAARARAYREVLSLLLALRAPSRRVNHPNALAAQADVYLGLLSKAGIISPRLRERALRTRLSMRPPGPPPPPDFTAHKAADAVRMALLAKLGMKSTYALDRLDLTAQTTIDRRTQKSVRRFLERLSAPDAVQMNALDQPQLLDEGNPKSIIYSVTLYERGTGANVVRARADSFNQPLDISQGTKLQLGSTAKLRTLIEYLQIVERLHDEYAGLPAAQLRAVPVMPGDHLTEWALDYLAGASDRSLEPMLEAALQRKYSANPGEAFFTAGGLHHFGNFEHSEDSQILTVSEAFRHSVNLVFIRLMRDIERYYMFRVPGASPNVLSDPNDPARLRYLQRFADFEGRTFLRRFYSAFQGETSSQMIGTMISSVHLTPLRAAVIFRSVYPRAGFDQFTAFLRAHLPAAVVAQANSPKLYAEFAPGKFNLNDRGYLAHVHPLALWLAHYLDEHPKADLAAAIAHSAAQRQEVYRWLFRTRYPHAQDKRIETLLEIDAFKKIHRDWQKLGYPFSSLVPSYATSIGVSGDTPQALANLVGILLNNGVHYPLESISQLRFASGTPYETVMTPRLAPGRQVLSPLIARLVRREMIGVVDEGTGRRVRGGFALPGGVVLPIGGKTGTGDNRFHEYGPGAQLEAVHVVNRTAAFVFFIGNRFYGTILAFVPGRKAGGYNFTSALAVQVLKDLEPRLLPLIRPETLSVSAQPVGGLKQPADIAVAKRERL